MQKLFLISVRSTSSPRTSVITAKDLKRHLDEGHPVYLLDVRTPEEYREWHIPSSVNVPLQQLQAGERPDVPQDAQLVTICLHGARSNKARDILMREGHTVRSLEGGMVAWNSVFDVAPIPSRSAQVRQMRRIGKGCLSYVLVSGEQAVVVDPTLDIEAYLEEAHKMGADIVAVLDTHAHADHVSGGRRLAEATRATYRAPEEVGDRAADQIIGENGEVSFGNAKLRALATPGHTPGSLTFLLDDLALTGDTLFVESVGRPDLGQDPRPNAGVLWETLQERILALPEATRVLPGHYGEAVELRPNEPIAATLGELRQRLSALTMEKSEFADWIARNALPKPGNFDVIKRYNKGQGSEDLETLRDLEAGPNRCAVG